MSVVAVVIAPILVSFHAPDAPKAETAAALIDAPEAQVRTLSAKELDSDSENETVLKTVDE